jgi:hypothetical protein
MRQVKAKKTAPAATRAPRARRHTMSVEPGLYVLRYVSTRTPAKAPTVKVEPSPGNAASVAVVRNPHMRSNLLTGPGDSVFISAERRGSVSLLVKPSVRGGSLDAEVRLERVTSRTAGVGGPALESRSLNPMRADPSASPNISVLAHVSHRGDITAKQGEWICGPDLPIAIEGIQITWHDQPAGVELSYAVKTGGRDPQRLESATGGFAGTRGCSAPLVGLQIGLSGPRADRYELRCDALFLAAHVMSRKGQTLTLLGPTGLEPLVGIRIAIEQRSSAARAKSAEPRSFVAQGPVRIYRAASDARAQRAVAVRP